MRKMLHKALAPAGPYDLAQWRRGFQPRHKVSYTAFALNVACRAVSVKSIKYLHRPIEVRRIHPDAH